MIQNAETTEISSCRTVWNSCFVDCSTYCVHVEARLYAYTHEYNYDLRFMEKIEPSNFV